MEEEKLTVEEKREEEKRRKVVLGQRHGEKKEYERRGGDEKIKKGLYKVKSIGRRKKNRRTVRGGEREARRGDRGV